MSVRVVVVDDQALVQGGFAMFWVIRTSRLGPRPGPGSRRHVVLAAIAPGSSNAEISEELFIGEATVKSHVSSIFTKLGLRDRAQGVIFAYESGLAKAGDHDIGH